MMENPQHHGAIETLAGALQQIERLGVAPTDRGSGPGHICDQGENRQAAVPGLSPVAIRRGSIGVPGNYASTRAGSNTRVLAGVGADVEHRFGAQQLQGAVYEFLLAPPFVFAVMIGNGVVFAPTRIASFRLQRAQGIPKVSEVSLQNRNCDFRLLLQSGRCSRATLARFQKVRKCNERTKRSTPPFDTGKIRIKVRGLVSVTAMECGGQWPAEVFVGRQRQEKSARKLSVGKPQGAPRIAPLNRQQIHKDRARALEENIQWSGIFEDPALTEQLVA